VSADQQEQRDPGLTPIAAGLKRAAAAELARALAEFTSSSYASFYVHAGAALELEVKAALVRINPLLILDHRSPRWNHDARRVLADTPLTPGEDVRTLGATEAVRRLETIDPRPTAALAAWSQVVFQARNDVVHAGLVHADDHDSHIRVASAFFQSIMALRSSAAREPVLLDTAIVEVGAPDFTAFASSSGLVEEVVNNSTDAERVGARRSVDQARRKFEALQPEQRDMLRAAATVRINDEQGLLTLPTECVACGSTALAEGMLDLADLPDNEPGRRVQAVILAYKRVSCYVCGLKVSSRQLSLLGEFNAAIHPTATIDDLYDPDDYDPDHELREPDPDEYDPAHELREPGPDDSR
jgi:hypothetical protein